MKGFIRLLRHGLIAASLIGLAACGGGSNVNTVEISGTVSGLTTGDLSLTNGISTVNIAKDSTTFTFPNRLNIGLNYNVTVLSQPAGFTCLVSNGAGLAGYTLSNNIAVACAKNSVLGGTIIGLKGSGLVLVNGTKSLTVAAGATSFTFADKVMAGSAYGVTVLTQPAGQTCTVSNGAAVMGTSDVNSVVVTCI